MRTLALCALLLATAALADEVSFERTVLPNVVGDLAKIRPAIEKLGLGAVEVRDAEGKKIR